MERYTGRVQEVCDCSLCNQDLASKNLPATGFFFQGAHPTPQTVPYFEHTMHIDPFMVSQDLEHPFCQLPFPGRATMMISRAIKIPNFSFKNILGRMEKNLARRFETNAGRAATNFLSLFDFSANHDIHMFYSLVSIHHQNLDHRN